MQFLLSDTEAVDLLRTAIRRTDGMLVLDIPDTRLAGVRINKPHLRFDPKSRTVQYGSQSIRLSKIDFSLLSYLQEHGQATFEEAQDAVWGRNVNDSAIRKACSRLSERLLDADILFAILTRHGSILLEEVSS